MSDIRDRHAGKQCVSLSFMRPGDTRVAPIMRLMVQDSEMNIVVLLDMSAKEFADVMSGLNTWVPNPLEADVPEAKEG